MTLESKTEGSEMKFKTVREAYTFFRRAGFGRIRAYRFAKSVVQRGAIVEVVGNSARVTE
jgi:hypothetical protein